ncbi:hypothetical protein [Sorangium sp. So ce1153]|uniref:hypothetical protein n=1 Tax=Sorangium sp. So ce1153 TaxID=3133333 RepID=UPI003F5ECA28
MAKQGIHLVLLALLGPSPAALGCASAADDAPDALAESAQAVLSYGSPDGSTGAEPLPPALDVTSAVDRRLISTNGLPWLFIDENEILDALRSAPLTELGGISAEDLEAADRRGSLLRKILTYTAYCALDQGETVTMRGEDGKVRAAFDGGLGLARDWSEQPLNKESDQRWVSACLLAHANSRGKPHLVSLRGEGLPVKLEEATYTAQEAAYFGNLFVGVRPEIFACAGSSSSAELQRGGRSCGVTDDCNFTRLGSCSDRCDTVEGANDQSQVTYTNCPGGSQRYAEVITVYDKPPADDQFIRTTFRDATGVRDPADMDMCMGKAACDFGDPLVGLSEVPEGQVGVALCARRAAGKLPHSFAETLSAEGGVDQRRAQRLGDWAPEYIKLECGTGQYVSAVVNDAELCGGHDQVRWIECARGADRGGQCSVRVVDDGEDRGASGSGEWDFGKYKGECASGEVVVGVSVSPENGAPHSLLCCTSGGVSGEGREFALGTPEAPAPYAPSIRLIPGD